jgi:uncharacterized protein
MEEPRSATSALRTTRHVSGTRATSTSRKKVNFDVPEVQPTVPWDAAGMRLRSLLIDSVHGQSYVFDPETADITLVAPPVADALLALQKGDSVSQQVEDMLFELLGLEIPEELDSRHDPSWGLKLHLNHACNLGCVYCYADGRTSDADGTAKGAYGGPVSYMRSDVMGAALDKFMGAAPGDSVTIIFFGGEPLLSERRFLESVAFVKDRASLHSKSVQFSMTTNATKVTERIVSCLKENDFRVAVSVDGSKDTHDRQRPMGHGGGSYDRVIAGLERMSEAGIPVGVRMTAFRGRGDLAEDHAAIGRLPAVTTTFQFSFYGDDARRPMSEAERASLFDHYASVARRILEGDEEASRLGTVSEVLAGIVFKHKRQFQCGAGRQFWAVAAGGDVYPCHRFVGMSPYRLGNVKSQSFAFKSLGLFEGNAVRNRPVKSYGGTNCALCFAHHVCGGGCAQIAAANTGRIGELPPFYCQDTRLRVQAVVRSLAERTVAQSAG